MHRLVPAGSMEEPACLGELEDLAVPIKSLHITCPEDKRTGSNSFYVVVHMGALNVFAGPEGRRSSTLAHSTRRAAAGRNRSPWGGPDVVTGLMMLTASNSRRGTFSSVHVESCDTTGAPRDGL